MNTNTKERLLTAINAVTTLDDYLPDDVIYSGKYGISPTDTVYILQSLEKEFNFVLDDDFVDAMEMITFARFEALLEKYENTNKLVS